jgi:hypothetical protein
LITKDANADNGKGMIPQEVNNAFSSHYNEQWLYKGNSIDNIVELLFLPGIDQKIPEIGIEAHLSFDIND